MTETLREFIDTLDFPALDDNGEVARKKLDGAIDKLGDFLVVKGITLEDLLRALIIAQADIAYRAIELEDSNNKDIYGKYCLAGSILDLQILSLLHLCKQGTKKN